MDELRKIRWGAGGMIGHCDSLTAELDSCITSGLRGFEVRIYLGDRQLRYGKGFSKSSVKRLAEDLLREEAAKIK